MSSLSSLSRAVSGLMANQSALNTTAHNLSNVNTPGYVRQQVIMKDSSYVTIGRTATSLMQLGLGTDVQTIRQVRGEFLDLAYRTENSRYGFYSAQATSIDEIENIIGETEGEAFSKILNDLWTSISELSKHPEGLETRGGFIQNAALFVEKANLIGNQLKGYQENLNDDITSKINRINEIGVEIERLNNIVAGEEANGSNANDYRDQRNLLLDELSYLVDVRYREDPSGNLLINVENVPFVTIGNVNQLGTIQAEDFSNLVDPYWPHLSSEGPPPVVRKLYNLANPTGAQYDNNKGELKGMIISRG
ncbi:MAG: flagellar hook-associated protein FlgK, partial [Vallitaleaceae bacterium]|nr:flagellar hook-associated protein FlgK [Vallitaleaceae bacterium]